MNFKHFQEEIDAMIDDVESTLREVPGHDRGRRHQLQAMLQALRCLRKAESINMLIAIAHEMIVPPVALGDPVYIVIEYMEFRGRVAAVQRALVVLDNLMGSRDSNSNWLGRLLIRVGLRKGRKGDDMIECYY